MSLDRILFPTKPANPVRKLWRAMERFTDDYPIVAWLIVLVFAAVVMTVSAVVERAA